MFTAIAFNKSSWLEQKNHGFSIDTRPVLDHFPLVYRRPNENRTRIYLRTNERRTRSYRRHDEKMPNLMRRALKNLSNSFMSKNNAHM